MSSNKKKAFGEVAERSSDSEDDCHSEDNEQNDVYNGGEEIQVDFEGRNPQDSDFHGIKQLLQQLFLKAHVNLSELADIIIGQNYVGSVVKQSDSNPDNEMDDEDDESDINDVFGITTVINLTSKQNKECVQELRSLLTELAQEHAADSTNTLIRKILSDESNAVGLVINERFINIPAQISVPLLESLHTEVQRAKRKNMPFNFKYYLLICKLYKADPKGDRNRSSELIWSNPEEEVIFPEALASFEFSVKTESDTGHSGNWLEEDELMTPYRRVLILDAEKFDTVIDTVKSFVSA